MNFHAWAIARYVGQIAAAGKAVYPLPLYVNAALRDPLSRERPALRERRPHRQCAVHLEGGGARDRCPRARHLHVNDTAAYLKVLDLYHRPDNALFVPETSSSIQSSLLLRSPRTSGHRLLAFWAGLHANPPVRRSQADVRRSSFLHPTAQNYRLIGPMMRDIARLNFEGRLQAVAEVEGEVTQTLHFGAGMRWCPTELMGEAPRKEIPNPSGVPWLHNSRTTNSW